ncbi:MAG: hypothetical protein H7326_01995 [Bdellovibrionaceae bacterium]|nr:hypothetical protein [Pseudobdellovibrionaceae bacterium]
MNLFLGLNSKGSVTRAFLLLFSASLLSAFSLPTMALTIICKNDKQVRTLRTDKVTDGGCRAVYTKQGVDQVVGSSIRKNGCETILENIRRNLEGNVWKCKAVKEAAFSDLTE